MKSRGNEHLYSDVLRIVAAWILFLLVLGLLQAFGLPVGFGVWPLGEDRNWLSWLQRAHGADIARLFWQTNDRNPVSPWWYIAFKPLIVHFDNGILFSRYLMSLLCGIASYLCLRSVGGPGLRAFALAVGVLTAMFTANGYVDNIYWNFIGALAMSLLCVWAYAQFLRSGRTAVHWYGLSIALWFLALASYTLQSGAVLAIAYLAYASADPRDSLFAGVRARVLQAFKDAFPYLSVFAVFLLIWRTTSSPTMLKYYSMSLSPDRLMRSLTSGVWHDDFPSYLSWAGRPWQHASAVVALLAVGALVYVLIARATRVSEPHAERSSLSAFRDIAFVAVCIVAPTIAVEASSDVWGPGTRWRMVHQFWVPLYGAAVLAVVCGLVVRCLPSLSRARHRVWAGLIAAAAVLIVAIDLGHNQDQIDATSAEKRVLAGLREILSREGAAVGGSVSHFIIKLEPGASWVSQDVMSPVYTATWFPGQPITLRVLSGPGLKEAGSEPWFDVKFGSDQVGVQNVAIGGGTAPYSKVRVVAFDGVRLKSLEGATSKDFEGLRVKWERLSPLPLNVKEAGGPSAGCNVRWTPASSSKTTNFSALEEDPISQFQWTTSKRASVVLSPCDKAKDLSIEVTVAFALSDKNIEKFAMSLNGRPIGLTRTTVAAGTSYRGIGKFVPGPVEIGLEVPETVRPPGGDRDLGVAIRQIKVQPLD